MDRFLQLATSFQMRRSSFDCILCFLASISPTGYFPRLGPTLWSARYLKGRAILTILFLFGLSSHRRRGPRNLSGMSS
jgi:hypothetical protein